MNCMCMNIIYIYVLAQGSFHTLQREHILLYVLNLPENDDISRQWISTMNGLSFPPNTATRWQSLQVNEFQSRHPWPKPTSPQEPPSEILFLISSLPKLYFHDPHPEPNLCCKRWMLYRRFTHDSHNLSCRLHDKCLPTQSAPACGIVHHDVMAQQHARFQAGACMKHAMSIWVSCEYNLW